MKGHKGVAQSSILTLLSGGIDSMVLGDSIRHERPLRQEFLFVNYGHLAATRELEAARKYSKDKGKLHVVSIKTTGISIRSQLFTGNLRDPAFVPGRNLLLLYLGALKACELKIYFLAIGLRDVPEFSDTSDPFVRSFVAISAQSFGHPIEVITPLIHLSKEDVVALGRSYNTPLKASYSCYLGKSRPCGQCMGCKDRKGLSL